MDYSQHVSTRVTPQSEQASPKQVPNSAGGYSFQVDDFKRLERFLILGSEGGSYYASEKELTKENAQVVTRCLAADGKRTLEAIRAISDQGRAVKNSPAIFALAMACGSEDHALAKEALKLLPAVCRTGTHLFEFVQSVKAFRGWGRGLRRAVGDWYASRSESDLMYQLTKYQQRNGWSHKDLFRLAHPELTNQAIARWVVKADLGERVIAGLKPGMKRAAHTRNGIYAAAGALPAYLEAFEELKTADAGRTVALIRERGFTHEMIQTQHKNSPQVWEALLDKMPMTAMIRNLGKMTEVGLIAPLSVASKTIAERLGSADRLRHARVHPLSVLSALRVYASGHGVKGSLTWSPVPQITDALDGAFYLAFDHVEPTGKKTMLALDVSGSMMAPCAGIPGLSCRDVSAALAMVTARSEPEWCCFGFSTTFMSLNISPRQRLDDVIRTISNLPFQGTDCALPMVFAKSNGIPVEVFNVFTDSETYFGAIHPHQALTNYRQYSGINAKLAVVGMLSSAFTIADPADPGMVDIVGADTGTPQALAEFARL